MHCESDTIQQKMDYFPNHFLHIVCNLFVNWHVQLLFLSENTSIQMYLLVLVDCRRLLDIVFFTIAFDILSIKCHYTHAFNPLYISTFIMGAGIALVRLILHHSNLVNSPLHIALYSVRVPKDILPC